MTKVWLVRKVKNVCGVVRNMSTSTKNNVYIYNGEGASESSKLHLERSLVENLSTRYNVKFISPDDILKGTWTRDAALMAFGGGFDKGFIRTLGTAGVEMIRSYVLNGGKYLGICAGGYFGCDYIEFDKSGPLEVCGERHLKFFPGCGRGPVYPGFKYNDPVGSRAAPIDFQTSETTSEIILTYFNGGGCFLFIESDLSKLTLNPNWNGRLGLILNHLKPSLSSQSSGDPKNLDFEIRPTPGVSDVEILSRYCELPDTPPAIVKSRVGQGRAILCGVHIEYTPGLLLEMEPTLKELVKTLEETEKQRLGCFRSLLQQLDLEVK